MCVCVCVCVCVLLACWNKTSQLWAAGLIDPKRRKGLAESNTPRHKPPLCGWGGVWVWFLPVAYQKKARGSSYCGRRPQLACGCVCAPSHGDARARGCERASPPPPGRTWVCVPGVALGALARNPTHPMGAANVREGARPLGGPPRQAHRHARGGGARQARPGTHAGVGRSIGTPRVPDAPAYTRGGALNTNPRARHAQAHTRGGALVANPRARYTTNTLSSTHARDGALARNPVLAWGP